jgi:CRISPR-associated protein Csm1
MKEEERTVVLGALLLAINRYLPFQSVEQGKVTEPHESMEADFVARWRTNLARCVDADALSTLVLRYQAGRQSIDAALEELSVSHHHRALACLVSCASRLASSESSATHSASLAPVFDRVELERTSTVRPRHFAPRALTPIGTRPKASRSAADEPAIFAVPGGEAPSSELTLHLGEFEQQCMRLCERLDWENFECVYTHVLNLLQTYGWCLPAEGQPDPPDVSWYDQARVTSAIAACLYQFHAEGGTITEEAISAKGQTRCLLLTGDVSGIQEYIFGISTTGAGGVAKRLRARSFFVQLLSEAASQRVLREFELPLANLLMASGGNFYVLLPNLPDASGRLKTLQRDFDEWLLRETHGALAINLAWTDLPDSDFAAGKYSAVVSRLHSSLRQRKAQRLARALQDEGTWRGIDAFAREPFEGEQVCKACNRFPAAQFSKPKTDRSPDADADICHQCFDQQKLGRDLTRAQYVLFYDDDKGAPEGRITCLGFKVSVRSAAPLPESERPAPFLVLRLNHPDLGNVARLPAAVRYLTNHVPSDDDGIPWTFEDIAAARKLTEHESSSKLLGVLKADVDHLGLLFQEGLRRDAPGRGWDSISRISSLSRQLDWFFSGWLEWLLTTSYQDCYAVYSGGDDLLIVGPRQKALDLARKIHDDFARYTQNDEITISAGIAVVKPRLPLSHTVRRADGELVRAKEAGRDRLCLLGDAVTWKDFEFLLEQITDLVSCKVDEAPSSFLYHLLRYASLYRTYRHDGNPEGLRYHSLLSYQIGRTLQPHSRLYQWARGLLEFPPHGEAEQILSHLRLVTQWVLLERRQK